MPPRMNNIASRDQFKPIRIGENLVADNNNNNLLLLIIIIIIIIII